MKFQFTLPRGERRIRRNDATGYGAFQFTLPRGERPRIRSFSSSSNRFNSRSHAGSDLRTRSASSATRTFQFTLPRGERLSRLESEEITALVSIHAPTRGATDIPARYGRVHRFNSRSHAGSDAHGWFDKYGQNLFQFTLPRGERLSTKRRRRYGRRFNSRSHAGSDDRLLRLELITTVVSIHAPTRGATFRHGNKDLTRMVSIHAPTRGATTRQI